VLKLCHTHILLHILLPDFHGALSHLQTHLRRRVVHEAAELGHVADLSALPWALLWDLLAPISVSILRCWRGR